MSKVLKSLSLITAFVLVSVLFFQNCGSAGLQWGTDNAESGNLYGPPPPVPDVENPGTVAYNPDDPLGSMKAIFTTDVQPIVESKCLRCHQEGAIGANFKMKTARSLGIREVGVGGVGYANAKIVTNHVSPIESGAPPLMPPFDAYSSSDCVNPEFRNNYGLDTQEIKIINFWLGLLNPHAQDIRNSKSNVSVTLENLKLTIPTRDTLNENSPDVVPLIGKNFNFETDYLSAPTSDGSHCPSMSDCYIRTPGISFGNTTEVFLTDYQVVPENPELVHHVVLYEDGSMGKTYIVWAPGVDVEHLPPGSGIRIPANTKFTLDIHYNSTNAVRKSDLGTRIRGKLVNDVSKKLDLYMFGITGGGSMTLSSVTETEINRTNHSQSSNLVVKSPINGAIFGLFPHMHKYGTKISLKLKKKNGSKQCLTHVPRWRFAWQLNYFPKDPIAFYKDEEIELSCGFKGITSGNTTVQFGENSDNEMCLGVVMYQTL